jgi:hypothetical protein
MQGGLHCTFRSPLGYADLQVLHQMAAATLCPLFDLFACKAHKTFAGALIAVTSLTLLLANPDRAASPTCSL